MMPRYIDAEALMQKLCKPCGVKDREYFCHAHCGDRMNIENMPTADVQPVKHGRWIVSDDGYVRCSECKSKAFIENDETIITDFCHGCGADLRMDGDSE